MQSIIQLRSHAADTAEKEDDRVMNSLWDVENVLIGESVGGDVRRTFVCE